MVRRALDLIVAVVGLIVLGPLMLLVALAIKIESRGPAFYNRHMVGHRGRPFDLFGFRTMTVGSEAQVLTERLTRVGRLVRNISLDHLPQLLNLLHGDVSIIGPRAMEIDVVDLSDPVWRRYVSVRPGLMSYAVLQLGRRWTPARATQPTLNQELELVYLEKRSAVFDIALALQGLRALVASGGNVKARGETDSDAGVRLNR